MHLEAVEQSQVCGCFHCLAVFAPEEITGWCDGEQTARCPRCGLDSVLPGGTEGVEAETLQAMEGFWFGG